MLKRLLIVLTLIAMIANSLTDVDAQGRRQRADAVDLLVLGGTIVTMDQTRRVIDDGGIAVSNGRIVAIGPRAEIESRYTSRQRVNARGKVLAPGLINGHSHVPMVLFRGLADDLDLQEWLTKYIFPAEAKNVTEQFVRVGARLGLAEMIRGGTTTYCDMYYFEDAVAEATADVGMRALCGQTVLRFPAPDARSYEEGLARAREFIERWKGHPLIVPAPAPHAPYTCTPEILRSCADLAAEFDVPLHIHLSETLLEVEDSRRRYGMPGVPYMRKQGLFDAKVLAAHCVHVDEGEIRALKNFGAGVAHNPSSNLKLAAGVAPAGHRWPVSSSPPLALSRRLRRPGSWRRTTAVGFAAVRLSTDIRGGTHGVPLRRTSRGSAPVR